MGSINGTKTYIYPDGTKSTTRPEFCEIFPVKDDLWLWVEKDEKWILVKPVNLGMYGQAVGIPPIIKNFTCDCGGESTNQPHYSWCNKNKQKV